MKWSRNRNRKQQQQQQQQSFSSSSSAGLSTFFKILPFSWISKFRKTKNSEKFPIPRHNPRASPDSLPFSSDHLSLSAPFFEHAPRRHSCATADEFRHFDRSRRRDDLLVSSRFDCDLPLLTCRSCRLDSFCPAPETKEKTEITSSGRRLESFAVVKRSIDPQRDFRESMVEMIEKNRMEKTEELERLLACYLTLNAEEYHDVIVKVFRQVWLDLNPKTAHHSRRRDELLYFPQSHD